MLGLIRRGLRALRRLVAHSEHHEPALYDRRVALGDGPLHDPEWGSDDDQGVTCKFCGEPCDARTAHLHQGQYVGDECCWDERLHMTE